METYILVQKQRDGSDIGIGEAVRLYGGPFIVKVFALAEGERPSISLHRTIQDAQAEYPESAGMRFMSDGIGEANEMVQQELAKENDTATGSFIAGLVDATNTLYGFVETDAFNSKGEPVDFLAADKGAELCARAIAALMLIARRLKDRSREYQSRVAVQAE